MGVAYIITPLMIFPEYLFFMSSGYMIVGGVWAATHPPAPEDEAEDDMQLEESITTG